MTFDNLIRTVSSKTHFKIFLLLAVSYFFLGMTEGSFIWFPDLKDTLVNFVFTVFCVGSSWLLFKYIITLATSLKTLSRCLFILIVLCSYITAINWVYIELLWRESLFETPFFSIVLPLSIPLFLSWSLIYPWLKRVSSQSESDQAIHHILVHQGKSKLLHPLADTLGFVVDYRVVFLISADGKKYSVNESLNELEKELTPKGFFRANRQLLIERKAVQSFKTVDNDKLHLELVTVFGDKSAQAISRYKAPKFRQWLKQ